MKFALFLTIFTLSHFLFGQSVTEESLTSTATTAAATTTNPLSSLIANVQNLEDEIIKIKVGIPCYFFLLYSSFIHSIPTLG